MTAIAKGDYWQGVATFAFCDVLHLPKDFYFETGLYHWSAPGQKVGDVAYDGFGCIPFQNGTAKAFVMEGASRPDFIISPDRPSKGRGYLVGDMKLRASTVYNAYRRPGGTKLNQFNAIAGYAQNQAYDVAMIATLFAPEDNEQKKALIEIVKGAAVTEHFVLFLFSLQTKRF